MNQKQLGLVLIIVGVVLALLVLILKLQIDNVYIADYSEEHGTCITPEGTCLHTQTLVYSFIAWGISLAVLLLGIYLFFFDTTQQRLLEQNAMIAEALKAARKKTGTQEKFDSFLAGFSEDEQNVLRAVHAQDGILQSTLRFRTSLSKSMLSHVLAELERKNIVARKPKGKSKEVFLKKKF